MSWKPSRSSGIMFDEFTQKSNENRAEAIRMIQSHEYVHFEHMKKFSKHIYLYWLNENKAHCALVSKSFNPQNPWRTLEVCCIFNQVYNMFNDWPQHIYKPLREYMEQQKQFTNQLQTVN